MSYTKSKQRVADHGEVFTPEWMVDAMLDLVKDETERIDARFLVPACGSGNFLVRILRRKLAAVELKYGRSDFERRHFALLALMCIYGIELLADNIAECRENMLEIFAEYLQLDASDELYRAASFVVSLNLVHGDALTMRTHDGQPICFAEWGNLGKGKFQRRDFRFGDLTQSAAFSAEGSLFAHLEKHELFTPIETYGPMTASELAAAFDTCEGGRSVCVRRRDQWRGCAGAGRCRWQREDGDLSANQGVGRRLLRAETPIARGGHTVGGENRRGLPLSAGIARIRVRPRELSSEATVR
jgi:hypothetical protein